MKKYLLIAAAAVMTAAPAYIAFQAQAEDAAAPAAAEAVADAATEVAAEVKEAKLADGTVVRIKGEEVFVVGADGAETPAPDGDHALEDGTTIKTMGGKVVVDAAPAEEKHEDGAAH